jgi:hypothetical protein
MSACRRDVDVFMIFCLGRARVLRRFTLSSWLGLARHTGRCQGCPCYCARRCAHSLFLPGIGVASHMQMVMMSDLAGMGPHTLVWHCSAQALGTCEMMTHHDAQSTHICVSAMSLIHCHVCKPLRAGAAPSLRNMPVLCSCAVALQLMETACELTCLAVQHSRASAPLT